MRLAPPRRPSPVPAAAGQSCALLCASCFATERGATGGSRRYPFPSWRRWLELRWRCSCDDGPDGKNEVIMTTTSRGTRHATILRPRATRAGREPPLTLSARMLLAATFLGGALFNALVTLRHPESLRGFAELAARPTPTAPETSAAPAGSATAVEAPFVQRPTSRPASWC
jgi:hypothetical protein